jgi:hypothetical protein
MTRKDEANRLTWPSWSWWVLAAVIVTAAVTIAATLYDIR